MDHGQYDRIPFYVHCLSIVFYLKDSAGKTEMAPHYEITIELSGARL